MAVALAAVALFFGVWLASTCGVDGYAEPNGWLADELADGFQFVGASEDVADAEETPAPTVPPVPSWVRIGRQRDKALRDQTLSKKAAAQANREGRALDLVMYGDSITAFHVRDPRLWQRSFAGVRAVPLAMGGSTVAELAARIISGGEKLAKDPRHLVILIGINDLKYGDVDPASRLDFLVQWLRATHPTTVLHIMALLPNSDVDVQPTNEQYRKLAASRGAQFLECPALDLARHYTDGTHPNEAGQAILLKCLGNVVRQTTSLPPPSSRDQMCKTWMSDPNDTGACFAMVYNHCVDGWKDQARIPPSIARVKQSALKQIYAIQRNCVNKERGTKCFDGEPKDWTTVCVARPELAGKGKCKAVAPDEWRVWVAGQDPQRKSECQFPSVYIKTHFRGDKAQDQYSGQHGRG